MNVIFRPNLSTSLPALVIELLRGGGGLLACLCGPPIYRRTGLFLFTDVNSLTGYLVRGQPASQPAS